MSPCEFSHLIGSVALGTLIVVTRTGVANQTEGVADEPGARTAWHTRPAGQTLIVTAGCVLVQRWGGSIEEIRPGDTVWISPGARHRHGATATTGVTHIAIQERLDGKVVDRMEKISDEQYRAGSSDF